MAETETTEVLERGKAVKDNILPTGRKVGIVSVRATSMYELAYVDGKAGQLPDEYRSRFTSIMYADRELKRFVNDLWDVSDKASTRSKKTITLNQANAIG